MKTTSDKTTPLFSLLDEFKYVPEELYTFLSLGDAPRGAHHITVFFRHVHNSVLHIDHSNPIRLNNHCTLYSILNESDSIFGQLYVVNANKYHIKSHTLYIGNGNNSDFVMYPYTSDKNSVFVYKDKYDNTLINISEFPDHEFVVLDG